MAKNAFDGPYRDAVGRARRFDVPGLYWHVGSRGNDSRVVFVDDEDRHEFLRRLGRTVTRHGWTCLAYCLMTNHYHLVLELPAAGLSPGMQELNGGFSRSTNQRHGRKGHLFENRFRGVVIGDETHLLEACRYVVLNPVRAGICCRPVQWRWSSYRASAGIEPAPAFLAMARLASLFGSAVQDAAAAYREFVALGVTVSDTVPSR